MDVKYSLDDDGHDDDMKFFWRGHGTFSLDDIMPYLEGVALMMEHFT
jgi:hypothetical protein